MRNIFIFAFFGVLSVLFFRYDKVPLRPLPPLITQVMAKEEPLWEWKGAPSYKNERLSYYQNLLKQKGITKEDHLKLLTATLLQDNGALAEDIHGDSNCSVGIPQRNVCNFGYTASSFVKKYPAWKDWKYQMQWMADYTVSNYTKFKGDVFKTIVNHNCPACAMKNRDTKAGYYKQVLQKSNLLILRNAKKVLTISSNP